MGWIIFVIFVMTLYYWKKLKIKIDFKSFFKSGFEVLSNRFGVVAYCGKQGTFKTYSSVLYCSYLIDNGSCDVFITNVKSYYDWLIKNAEINGSTEGFIYCPDFLSIIELCSTYTNKRVVVFFDEIFTAIEKVGSLSHNVLEFLAQCRKRHIIVITTVQEWAELNISLRRFVRFQVNCSYYIIPFINRAVVFNDVNDGDSLHWDSNSNDFISDRIQTNIHKAIIDIGKKYDTFETIKSFRLLNKSK